MSQKSLALRYHLQILMDSIDKSRIYQYEAGFGIGMLHAKPPLHSKQSVVVEYFVLDLMYKPFPNQNNMVLQKMI